MLLVASGELYGRYIDDILCFTSKESFEQINQMLKDANRWHTNIKLTTEVGTNVSFLDLFIENQRGVLTASVYHKDASEPYVLPFQSNHSRHIFSNIIRGCFKTSHLLLANIQ